MTQIDPEDVPKRDAPRWSERLMVGGLIVGGLATVLWLGVLVTLGAWATGFVVF